MSWSDTPLSDRSKTPEARVLLAALHQDRSRLDHSSVEQLSPAQWDRLVTVAGDQRVRPLLHERLTVTGHWSLLPKATWKKLCEECRSIALDRLRTLAELLRVLRQCEELGIRAMVLKGAYLGPVVYRNTALREMADVDIMVPRPDAEQTARALIERGYREHDRFPVNWQTTAAHHASLTKPGVCTIEVHWALAPADQVGAKDTEALWTDARVIDLAGARAWTLSPIDQLLHVCVHAAYQHNMEFGVRPFCDIQRLITHFGDQIHWHTMLARARERGAVRGVCLALVTARELVGADVPLFVDDAVSMSAPLRDLSREMVWTTGAESRLPFAISDIAGEVSWRRRFAIILNRVFPPKTELLEFYRVDSRTPVWRWLYARRAVYLLRRRVISTVVALTSMDRHAGLTSQSRNRLRDWLTVE